MSTPIGAQGHLGIVKEGSFASGGTISAWIPVNDIDINLIFSNVYGERIMNTAEQVGGIEGNRHVSGSFSFGVTPKGSKLLWELGVGQDDFPFYFERPLNSFAVEVDRETAAVKASGCIVSSMTIASGQGGELTCSVAVEGADMASTTAGTPSYTSGDVPYLHSDASFEISGASETGITAFNLNINNNALVDLYGTQRINKDIPAGKQTCTGSFTKLFDSTTERNAFLAATARSFKATFTRSDQNLTFWMPKVRYDNRAVPMAGQSEYILETFEFTAYTDDPENEFQLAISGDNT